MLETRDDSKCVIVISISLDLRDKEEGGSWKPWKMDQLIPREANAKKGKAIVGAGLGGNPANISRDREGTGVSPQRH